MPLRLDTRQPDFASQFHTFLGAKREASVDVETAVRAIVADVIARGDEALIELSGKFDRIDLAERGIRVSADEIADARASVTAKRWARWRSPRRRIEAYHRRQLPQDDRFTDALGVELGQRWTAIEAVGLYVPGGTAAYPSSVLMNAVPAKVAGVPRIVMVVPAPDGKLTPLVLAAAEARRRRRDLPRRRRAGGRRARLRHADDRAGRQDRRARQRLCGGRQAPGVRQGRHRHDRRPVRGAGPGRPRRQSRTGSRPTSWPRPSTTRPRSRS